ncbi:Response regulator UvrY [Pontiella desulfatans]|uniref:Response regulator UvrY n=1 Tax=Pontiella desulfatans TaxID=2750659 RepID=A0A6C2U945_PONDE|nr:response regulator transcription factor [Pontiella desulfatans]VGO16409.1 Response regulator UvrY [Pontiella desulfatans]
MNVWIVEDDAGYRRNLRMSLEIEEGITVQRVFPSCIELFDELKSGNVPEMILMDLGLPGMSGTEAIRQLTHMVPDVSVLVLTVFKEKEKVETALEAGAAGYLLKESGGPEIIKGLWAVYESRVPA